jgi:uncharacterized membrane protein
VTDVVLFFHLVGVLFFVAGIVLAAVGFESARRRQRPAEIALLLGLARTGALLVIGAGGLLLVCGLWLVDLADVGYGAGWIVASLVLFALALLLGGLGGQRPKRARKLAERLAADGDGVSRPLRTLLDDPTSQLTNYAAAALVLAILALMVFQP